MYNMYKGEYIPPTLTVDTVVFQLVNDQLAVLLIQRASEPFKDKWALPGVYNAAGETTRDAMNRALKVKAGINPRRIRLVDQLYTFDTVARDPRGHAVSVSYLCLGDDIQPRCGGLAQNPTFWPIGDLPVLAFDHDDIIRYAHNRLASRITYSSIISALLPNEFTLSELQRAHEAILFRSLDKRNFRKKFLSLGLIHETGESRRIGAHRPAKLYVFNSHKLVVLENKF
jgi:8-oxo-dGTP diphosphatase